MSFLLDFSPRRLDLPNLPKEVARRDKEWREKGEISIVPLKPHQLILLYIIATDCENKDGKPMTPRNRYEVVEKCLFGGTKGTEEFVTRFATPSESIAKHMKEWIAKSGYKDRFLENTGKFLDIHKEELETANLRVHIRKATEA